jgi:hypothetical protein
VLGEAKTRLARSIGPAQASAIYCALVAHQAAGEAAQDMKSRS